MMRSTATLLLLAAAAGSAYTAGAEPSRPTHHVTTAVRSDTSARSRDSITAVLLEKINGKEEQPAESVFLSIKLFKGTPAGRLLRIMNTGWGKALGVGCDHCHMPDAWAREDNLKKQVARDMSAMVGTINKELLANIRNLKSEKPSVGCTTCHRGEARPSNEAPGSPPR